MSDEPNSPDPEPLMEILTRQKEITIALRGAVDKVDAYNKALGGIMMHLRSLEERVSHLEKPSVSPKPKRKRKRKHVRTSR